MIVIDKKMLVNVISRDAVLMRLLKRLFFQRGSLMLFPLVREMLSFYNQRHSSMIPSLTFISSKHDSRSYKFSMDSNDDAIIDFYSEK